MSNTLRKTFFGIVGAASIVGCVENSNSHKSSTPVLKGNWDTKITKTTDGRSNVSFEGTAKSIWETDGKYTHVISKDGRHYIVDEDDKLDTTAVDVPEAAIHDSPKGGISF